MKAKIVFALLLVFSTTEFFAQVGIGNTNPNATLDISASNATSPTNEDGLLIPRIDEFPVVDPGAPQDGMMVFVTGNGSASEGFYYWDNATTSWVSFAGGVNTQNTLDEAYDEGGPGAGRTITADNGAVVIEDNGGLRVESTNETHMLFVDGVDDAIGIGENSPVSPIHIGKTTSFDTSYANTGQDGLFVDGGSGGGINGFGGSIGFGPSATVRKGQRKAAIAAVQTANDEDLLGLAFFVHGNNINMSPMVEGMRLTHERFLGINNNDPSANLDVVGSLQFVDGNESTGYVLSSDAAGNASWTDPSTLLTQDADFYQIGTSSAPTNISDDIYTLGNVKIGSATSVTDRLHVNNPVDETFSGLRIVSTGDNPSNITYGLYNQATIGDVLRFSNNYNAVTGSSDATIRLIENQISNTGTGEKTALYNEFNLGAPEGNKVGVHNRFEGGDNNITGIFTQAPGAWAVDGTLIGVDNDLNASGDGVRYGVRTTISSSATGTGIKYASYNFIDSGAGGTHYGVYSRAENTSGYAGYFRGRFSLGAAGINRYFMPETDGTAGQVMTTNGAGTVSFQDVAGDDTDWYVQGGTTASTSITDDIYTQGNVAIGNTTSTGTTLYVETDPSVNTTSISSVLSAASAGIVTGIENNATVNGTATAYLNRNYIGGSSSSSGTRAIFNTFAGGGGGTKTGMYNFFTFGFSGNARGVENNFSNTGISSALGLYNTFTTTASTATATGVYNIATSSLTANTLYGNRTLFTGATVSNEAYGSYNFVATTGTDYGLYAQVNNNATDYAAFLSGRVSLGHDPVSNRYFMPGTDGTAGQVMTTDGAGNLSFQTFSVAANTLDEAYDEGGAGAGRTITADAGAVTVAGQDGFFVTGAGYGASGTAMPILGEGARMFFDPSTAAFRAGEVRGDFGSFDDNVWDQGNLGDYSIAMGLNPEATADNSIALGSLANSSSTNAVAIGSNTVASNIGSLALGSSTTASGQYATAAGFASQASGNYSFAIGRQVDAPSYGEVAVGMFPTTYTPSSTTSFVDTDRLFTVANGNVTSVITRSNALTIYKSGLMNINDEYNMPLTDGTVGQVMTTDGAGNVTFQTPSPESTTASNGLTEAGDDIQLGGTLTQVTSINQDSYNLNFIGSNTGNINILQTGTSDRGLNISKSDNLSGFSYGLYVNKTSSGTGRSHAIYNFVDGTGTGQKYGVFNRINTASDGSQYGTRNWLSGDTPATQFGTFNNLDNNGTGNTYGVYNGMRVTNASNAFGVYNEFNTANSSFSLAAGVRNRFTAGTPGSNGMAGVYTDFDISNNGDLYGNRTEFAGTATGTGNKYGTYNVISSGAGGNHYGTYNNVNVSSGWAGYFLGKNYISEGLGINNPNPDGRLDIIHNSTGGNSPHIMLTAQNADSGTRITFDNAAETTNNWVLFARADDTSGDGVLNFFSSDISSNILRLESDGKVGIMRNPTTNALEVGGDASKTTAGSWAANSDRRLKTNIEGISGKTALEKIHQMRGVTYFWNDDKTGIDRPESLQYGFIAQELMQVFPDKVTKDNLGFYQTAYGDYDPIFVEAIKELNTKIDNLESENEQLKQQLQQYESLEARISALEGDKTAPASETATLSEEKE